MTGFSPPKQISFTLSVNVFACLLGRGHNGLVRNRWVWQSPVDYFFMCNMISLVIIVFIAAIKSRCSWYLLNIYCLSIVIYKNLFWLLVTAKLYLIHFWWCTDIRSHGHSFPRDFCQSWTFVLTSNDHPGHSCSHQMTNNSVLHFQPDISST